MQSTFRLRDLDSILGEEPGTGRGWRPLDRGNDAVYFGGWGNYRIVKPDGGLVRWTPS